MKTVAKENLLQIRKLLDCMTAENYIAKPEILSGASIGQHVRHVLEFYILLLSGSHTGTLSYDKRERDVELENKPDKAIDTIDKLIDGFETIDIDIPLLLEADCTSQGHSMNQIKSSVGRELAYCIEHSIHHQALIKAGLIALNLGNTTDDYFGVAFSTIRYRKDQCAQ